MKKYGKKIPCIFLEFSKYNTTNWFFLLKIKNRQKIVF